MGERGPIPNRSGDLSRARDANRADRPELTKGTAFPVTIPDPNPEWHHVARLFWESLQTSGQREFYQDSDWAVAYMICEDISRLRSGEVRQGSAMLAQTIYSAMSNLLVTEADRRRVRIELEAPQPVEEPVHLQAVRDAKARLGLGEE